MEIGKLALSSCSKLSLEFDSNLSMLPCSSYKNKRRLKVFCRGSQHCLCLKREFLMRFATGEVCDYLLPDDFFVALGECLEQASINAYIPEITLHDSVSNFCSYAALAKKLCKPAQQPVRQVVFKEKFATICELPASDTTTDLPPQHRDTCFVVVAETLQPTEGYLTIEQAKTQYAEEVLPVPIESHLADEIVPVCISPESLGEGSRKITRILLNPFRSHVDNRKVDETTVDVRKWHGRFGQRLWLLTSGAINSVWGVMNESLEAIRPSRTYEDR